MRINKVAFEAMIDNRYAIKLPRKIKKIVLGKKLSKSKLKKLLDAVVIESHANTMYETPNIKPYLFCPWCGCTLMIGTGNLSAYPEHWEKFFCGRCNNIIGYIDNSPFVHALECKDNNYDPTF